MKTVAGIPISISLLFKVVNWLLTFPSLLGYSIFSLLFTCTARRVHALGLYEREVYTCSSNCRETKTQVAEIRTDWNSQGEGIHFHIWNKEDEANQRPTLHKSISQLQEIDDNVAKNKEHNKQSKQLQQMWLKTLYPSCKSCYSIEVCKR